MGVVYQVDVTCAFRVIFFNMSDIRTSAPYDSSSHTYDVYADAPFNITCDYSNVPKYKAPAEVSLPDGLC